MATLWRKVDGPLDRTDTEVMVVRERSVGFGLLLLAVGSVFGVLPAGLAVANAEPALLLVALLVGLPLLLAGVWAITRRLEASIDGRARQVRFERRGGLRAPGAQQWPFDQVRSVRVQRYDRVTNASGGESVVVRYHIVLELEDEADPESELTLCVDDVSVDADRATAFAREVAERIGAPIRAS